jgi:(E)-4-hydroxy-3-methylbut-2-enyl-diphosphate synthase
MTPERLAMLEKQKAADDADAIDEALSPVAGRRFTRA